MTSGLTSFYMESEETVFTVDTLFNGGHRWKELETDTIASVSCCFGLW